MNMKQAVAVRTIKEVIVLVKAEVLVEVMEAGMFLHVTSVVNKDTRWQNVLRIKMMEEEMKQGHM